GYYAAADEGAPMQSTNRTKQLKAKYAVFASQFFKAFQVFCQENSVSPDMKNFEVLQAFYRQKHTAKALNTELKKDSRRNKKVAKGILSKVVRPNTVQYNKGFDLINGDTLVEQKPISDKTQVCEPEYLTIQ
ncbi:MAG: hypothetical protein ACRCUJ_02895, partial [Phocaeicola sp.]